MDDMPAEVCRMALVSNPPSSFKEFLLLVREHMGADSVKDAKFVPTFCRWSVFDEEAIRFFNHLVS